MLQRACTVSPTWVSRFCDTPYKQADYGKLPGTRTNTQTTGGGEAIPAGASETARHSLDRVRTSFANVGDSGDTIGRLDEDFNLAGGVHRGKVRRSGEVT